MSELVRKGTIGVMASVLAFELITGSASAVSAPEVSERRVRPITDAGALSEIGAVLMNHQVAPNRDRTSREGAAYPDIMYGIIVTEQTAATSTLAETGAMVQRRGH